MHGKVCLFSSRSFTDLSHSSIPYRIEAQQAVDIKLYSATYAEEEMLLLPGTELKVRGAVQLAEDVWEVQLEEIVSPFPMVS